MIEFVRGTADFVTPEYVVIDVNGVGYQVFCPNPFVYQKNIGETVKIHTYQYVREDVIALYGFKTREERALFVKLLNVSGIGPKGGLAILASGEPSQVVQAIEEENEAFLTKFPGVGKKTARQMILDLKGKLQDMLPDLFTPDAPVVTNANNRSQELEEAFEALEALGYAKKELVKVEPVLAKERLTTEQYIKKALQLLLTGGRR